MYYYGYTNEKTNRPKFKALFGDIQELKPKHDSHSSFNGRAYYASDKKGNVFLISYNTVVIGFNADSGFHRLWGDYSATTMRHISEFCKQLGYPAMSKKTWESMPVETWEGF